jgi:hypothetical protein
MDTLKPRAARTTKEETFDYAGFRESAKRFDDESGPLLHLYLKLSDLVAYPRHEEFIDRVSDDILSVSFLPRGEHSCILVSICEGDDGQPMWEYSFHNNGSASSRDPSKSKLPCERYIDWDSGQRHLMKFLFMMIANCLSVEAKLGYLLWCVSELDMYIC